MTLRTILHVSFVCAAMVWLLASGATGVYAQESNKATGEPVHLGTFEARTRDGDDFDPDGSGSHMRVRRAEVVYKRALAKLRDGKRRGAQRALETLVARFPDVPQADAARRELAHIYADLDVDNGVRQDRPEQALRDFPRRSVGRNVEGSYGRAKHVEDGSRKRPTDLAVGEVRGEELARLRSRVSEPLSENMRIAIGDRIFFGGSSDALGAKARRVLRAQAKWLRSHSRVGVLIEGHADEPGNAEQNVEISVRRAVAVRERLIAEGVARERLYITAAGRSVPVAECGSRACAAQNRRVVTLVLGRQRSAGSEHRGGFEPDRNGYADSDDLGRAMWLIGPSNRGDF